ncbi:TonB-dependent receptor [Elongatibacter sediminis]|uniref:TonB-dependent receptor n=1 Tax=Elongatibacter sediminis TaxID=3119006 RepID=A0AAW9RBN9_9GAMM
MKAVGRTMLVAMITAPFASSVALAQDGKTLGIEEVVVTAQRREQNLQDVPISISAFTANDIEKSMFSDVAEYVTRTPNASFISNGARSRRQVSIRGITNFLGFVGSSTTGFYVDDFSVAASTINPPIMDIERIEILRGPQATYFGRNALGGGISITSKKPHDAFEGSAMVDYSRYDTLDTEAVLNVPLIGDTLAVRFNAKSISSDGNIKNINPVGGGNDQDYDYIKTSVRWTPTDKLTIDAMFQYATEEVGMREGIPSGVFSDFAGNVLYRDVFPDRDGDGRGDPFVDTVGFWPDNTNRTNFDRAQSVGTNLRNGVVRVDYEHNDLLFTSITGFINSDFFLYGDIDGSSRDFFYERRNNERESFSTEFRIQNTGDSPFQWNIGALYAEDDGTDFNRTLVGAEMPFGLPEGTPVGVTDELSGTDSWAIFGQVDYDLSERLTISGGGRYSEETKTFSISSVVGVAEQFLTAKDTFTDFSPRVALTFRASDAVTWYGTISKGYKSGGVQVAPNPEAETYDPEELWNYEIGLKTELFDRRLRLNASVFYMDWSDLQVAFRENLINEDGDFVQFAGVNNADSASSKGVELTASALLSEQFQVNFNVGYLDAEFDQFVALIDGDNRVLDGQVIPNSPEWTMNADAQYDFRYSDNWSGYVRLEWNYRDGIKPTTTSLIYSGFPWDVPSYDFFNLRIGAERDQFRVVAYVENLFDEKYYTNAYQKAFAGGLFIEPSYQNYGVRVTYSFE